MAVRPNFILATMTNQTGSTAGQGTIVGWEGELNQCLWPISGKMWNVPPKFLQWQKSLLECVLFDAKMSPLINARMSLSNMLGHVGIKLEPSGFPKIHHFFKGGFWGSSRVNRASLCRGQRMSQHCPGGDGRAGHQSLVLPVLPPSPLLGTWSWTCSTCSTCSTWCSTCSSKARAGLRPKNEMPQGARGLERDAWSPGDLTNKYDDIKGAYGQLNI